jgi:hypothetical protein
MAKHHYMATAAIMASALALIGIAASAAGVGNAAPAAGVGNAAPAAGVGNAAPAAGVGTLAPSMVAAAPAAVVTVSPAVVPGPEALVIMIRSSLVAFSQANLTNNYAVLSALASPSFRAQNSPQRLSQLFEPFRKNNIDLAPVTYVAPLLSTAPRVENGKLRLIGYFPTQPMRVDYDLTFEPVSGKWQLFGLSVNLKQTATDPANPPPPQK